MKLALLGKGKTGSFVLEVAREQNIEVKAFDSKNPATLEALKDCDAVICFLPAQAFQENLELLLESRLPVVSGTTGFEFSKETLETIKADNLHWLHAHNFALGMTLIREMIQTLSQGRSLFNDVQVSIHEVHHTKKLDAPSGTALSWKEWIGGTPEVSSERTGDVVGDHQIIFQTASEKITLRHQALNRRIFAEGAVWATQTLIKNKENLEPQLYTLNELTEWITKG